MTLSEGLGPGSKDLLKLSDRRPFGSAQNGAGGAGGEEGLRHWLKECLARLRDLPKADPPLWEELEAGLFFGKAKARRGPRFGSADIFIIRADPRLWILSPFWEGEVP